MTAFTEHSLSNGGHVVVMPCVLRYDTTRKQRIPEAGFVTVVKNLLNCFMITAVRSVIIFEMY